MTFLLPTFRLLNLTASMLFCAFISFQSFGQNEATLIEKLKDARTSNDDRKIVTALTEIAFYYWDNNNRSKALGYFSEALPFQQKVGNDNGVAHTYNYIGMLHAENKNFNDAIKFLKLGIETRKEMKDQNGTSNSLLNLGITYFDMGNYQKSVTTLEEALSISRAINAVLLQSDCLSYLSKAHEKLGNGEQALEYQRLYTDSFQQEGDQYINGLQNQFSQDKAAIERDKQLQLLEKEKQIEILKLNESRLQALAEKRKAELALQEKQIELQDAQLKQFEAEKRLRTIFIAALASGLVMLIIIAVILFRAHEQKKKANALLKKRQAIIQEQNGQLKAQNIEISENREEIKRVNHELTEMNKELVKMSEDKNDILRIVANDLRPPLKHVEMLIGIIKGNTNTTGDQQDIVNEITKSTIRINDMISQMLKEAEIDAAVIDLHFGEDNPTKNA